MTNSRRKVAILGSTGSIGCSTLEVVAATNHCQVFGLSARSQLDTLVDQARQFQPNYLVASDAERAAQFDWADIPKNCQVLVGEQGLIELATSPEVDIVVAAIVGSAGLQSTWAALEAGKTVALANKETLVVAGPLVTALAKKTGATILPVDSEHCAVFQAIQAGRPSEVERIILTASGGPFRRHTKQQLQQVTVEDALAHPTWDMGPKITVDSATMMNKALEIIEARWLFDLPPEKIDVVVHPQSIVHSLVEYVDGAVLAQMSPPDMKLPIQYALTYPERHRGPAAKLDLNESFSLDFEPPDYDRFPALLLGKQVAQAGGTSGAVLNAANEAAVAEFLDGKLAFTEIVPACREVLDQHNFDPNPTLDQLLELDRWARQEIMKWICT
jgi:1-deoxy-D-xylulose-5-phosphate reductoisomerase